MKNTTTSLAASGALIAVVACGSSGGGPAGSGQSGASGDGGSGDGGRSNGISDDSGGGGGSSGGTGDSGFLFGDCASAADCVDSGVGAICCLNSSFRAVCQMRPCPFTSFGIRQLCASSAECTSFGLTSCYPIAGSTTSPLLVCGPPLPDAGTAEDSGGTTVEGGSDANVADAASDN
jgi:hypothetical protein